MSMPVRVRFAPSPTGFMHLGSVRIAVINYLFAKHHNGSFILRIEDTDAARNRDDARAKIIEDMQWLHLPYNEGPDKGGHYGPYLQSERNDIYQHHLQELVTHCKVYRCFCTAQQLEEKRQKQIAMGKPPRYDRTCMALSDEKIKAKLAANLPFVWRFKLNPDQVLEIYDMARGTISFEMKHFSDFAITRPDGTCTFMFVNFIDDWLMKISHVIRGEDHLSNTAMQAALYDAFAVKMPIFWHLQIICNTQGEKLSKRDFGFSLEDLRQAGYLPEAVCNYMATVGASFAQEMQTLHELAANYPFDRLHHTGGIRYDVDKLKWFNHKWMERLDTARLLEYLKPFLYASYPHSNTIDESKLTHIVEKIKGELTTLHDIKDALAFFFTKPAITKQPALDLLGEQKIIIAKNVILAAVSKQGNALELINTIKTDALAQGLKTKEIFSLLRYLLTGSFEGIGIIDLVDILGLDQSQQRLSQGLEHL